MRNWWRKARQGVLVALLHATVKLLSFTLRVTIRGQSNSESSQTGKIVASWHGRGFLGAAKFGGRGWWVLISQSSDGELISGIFSRFGYKTIRGSTRKGGSRAAVEVIRILRQGGTIVITPDGPRGPSNIASPGIILLAQKSGATIVPVANSIRPRKIFRSWDRYMLPLPFAKCLVEFGEPINVPQNASDEDLENIRLTLEAELNKMEASLEKELGYK